MVDWKDDYLVEEMGLSKVGYLVLQRVVMLVSTWVFLMVAQKAD